MLIQVIYGRIGPVVEGEIDPDGDLVQTYTYSTGLWSVGVGDVVLVPPTWVNPKAQEATVVALGSSYDGPATEIIKAVERAAYLPDPDPTWGSWKRAHPGDEPAQGEQP